jgi:hypothetical protein
MATAPSEPHTTRPFAAGAFGFTVATAHTDDHEIVESLFRDLPPPDPGARAPARFSVLRQRGEWALEGPRLGARSAAPFDGALKLLLSAVNLCALDGEPEHLHLHAAAATNDGRAVVIAAQRDVGKTTTVAHLVARGWGFVTDETVRLPAGTQAISGVPKPLSIEPGGHELVAHLEPWLIPAIDHGTEGYQFVPMSASGATVTGEGEPHVVVLLRRPADAGAPGPATHVLHPADAVVLLMQETLDAERFGDAALRLAALAAASHCAELVVGTPTETADAIEALFALDPVEPVTIAVLPPSAAFSPGVVSLAVGDRTVVHDTTSGRIFALDAGAARVWGRLGGWSDDEIDVDGPVLEPFVAQLRALGVLDGAA